MTNLVRNEIESIKSELKKFSSQVPDYLSEELTLLAKNIDVRSKYIASMTSKITSKTGSKVKNITGAGAIFFWISKTLDGLNQNIEKEEKILTLKLQKDLLASSMGESLDDYIDPSKITKNKNILNRRLISSQNILEEKMKSFEVKEKELESYAIAFENQLASFSLSSVLKNEDDRYYVLKAMTEMSALFTGKRVEAQKYNDEFFSANVDHTADVFEETLSEKAAFAKAVLEPISEQNTEKSKGEKKKKSFDSLATAVTGFFKSKENVMSEPTFDDSPEYFESTGPSVDIPEKNDICIDPIPSSDAEVSFEFTIPGTTASPSKQTRTATLSARGQKNNKARVKGSKAKHSRRRKKQKSLQNNA